MQCKSALFTRQWFGVTYAEDKAAMIEEFEKLIKAGVYGEKLWG